MARKQKKKFKKRHSNQENRRRFCKFTALGIEEIDYKDINLLKQKVSHLTNKNYGKKAKEKI